MLERECCWPRTAWAGSNPSGGTAVGYDSRSFRRCRFPWTCSAFPFHPAAAEFDRPGGAGARRLCACRYHCRRCPCSSRSLLGLHEQLRRTFSTTEKSSSPEQRLFVGPLDLRRTNYNDTFIYHLMLQLRPATYFSQSTRFTSPRRYRLGGLARSRPELRMSGTNQMRPASSARMHQTKWCDLDLRFAASTEPTCSAVAGKMEAKVTASGAGLLACF